MTEGLKGSELSSLPQTDEELFQHIEKVHHVPVRRENETVEECNKRFFQENPEAGGPNCRCPECTLKRKNKIFLAGMSALNLEIAKRVQQ